MARHAARLQAMRWMAAGEADFLQPGYVVRYQGVGEREGGQGRGEEGAFGHGEPRKSRKYYVLLLATKHGPKCVSSYRRTYR